MNQTPIRLTASQREAITFGAGSLLVSAAAGSGKTKVLAERCVHLVCDVDRNERCDIDELLVVTFTNSAAAEMRARICATLQMRAEFEPSPYLSRQIALSEHAPICTLHSFCQKLLRENFSLVPIDPEFRIMSTEEALLMRRDVARRLFDERYERDAEGQFTAFIDAYGNGRDEPVMDMVFRLHSMLCSIPQPRDWLHKSIKRLSEAAQNPLEESKLGKELLGSIADELTRLEKAALAAKKRLEALRGFEKYVQRVHEWEVMLQDWGNYFRTGGLDKLVAEFSAFEPERAPAVKDGVANKEIAYALQDSVKKQIQVGELSSLLAFSRQEWQMGQQAILPHARLLLELAQEFDGRYAAAKAAVNGIDFSDLERKTLNLLRGPSAVARRCHAEYRHVLVDEYQDINGIQAEILKLVSAECVFTEGSYPPNLFTVGDLKQSIYRFRLADVEQFKGRLKTLGKPGTPGKVIHLQENFRSRPEVLDVINSVFARLMHEDVAGFDYDETHRLKDPPQAARTGGPPPAELHLLPRISNEQADEDAEDDLDRNEREATLCAREIKKLVESGSATYGDMAILLRSVKYQADIYARILRRHGIPLHHQGGSGFFEAREVCDTLALLSILDNQQQDIPMAAVLRSPLSGLENVEEMLGRIRLAFPLGEDGKTLPFHEAVTRYAGEKSDAIATAVRGVIAQWSRWRDMARERPLAELIWAIYQETGCLAYYAGLSDGNQRVANLLHLHQRARQFGDFLKQGLHRFISFVDELREEDDIEQPSLAAEDERSVRLMSIHGAKGLEFPIVFLPDLGKRFNLQDTKGNVLMDRERGLALSVVDLERQIRYPSLSSVLMKRELKRQTLAEEMRLLYVALTRAKERLVLIGTGNPSDTEAWRSRYSQHAGPLPAEEILAAQSILDWLGPVQAACGEKSCTIISHSDEEIRSWQSGATGKEKEDRRRLEQIARVSPLASMPPLSAETQAVVARLEFVYPHEKYTKLQAAMAATALGGGHAPAAPAMEAQIQPAGFLSAGELSATEIGDVTHRVLEHVDYHRPCDAADIDTQIARMVERGLLNAQESAAVDRASIQWFLSMPLGATLKANADALMREIPFALAHHTSPSGDPMDAVMVRGRIDLLVPTAGGVVLVDYKTDRVTAQAVDERAKIYLGQLNVYREAIERVAGKKVLAIHLAFLHPRIIWNGQAR